MNPFDIIASLRKEGFTLTDIAELSGVSVSLVSRVIHGTRRSKAVARIVAARLHRPVDEIWPPSEGASSEPPPITRRKAA